MDGFFRRSVPLGGKLLHKRHGVALSFVCYLLHCIPTIPVKLANSETEASLVLN